MVVVKTEQTKADLNKEVQAVEDMKRNATNAVLASIDLPVEEEKKKTEEKTEEPKKEEKPKEKSEEKEDKKEPEVEEFESDKTDEEILAAKDADLTEQEKLYKKQLEDDTEDELIPKSKVQKRIDSLTKRIRELETSQAAKKPEAVDQDTAKLEKMGQEELQIVKKNIRSEIRTLTKKLASGEDVNENRIDELDELSDKVDNAINTYSTRFQNKQLTRFQEAGARIIEDLRAEMSDEEIGKAAGEIKSIASEIYREYPKLHESEDGQALSLRLAADHWKAKQEFSVGESKTKLLRRSHKRLLRKVSLDSNVLKADKSRSRFDDLRKKASRGGTDEDKTSFVKEHPGFNIDSLIPDEFKS